MFTCAGTRTWSASTLAHQRVRGGALGSHQRSAAAATPRPHPRCWAEYTVSPSTDSWNIGIITVSDIISRHNCYHEHAAHQAGGEEAEDADEEQGEGGDCDQHPAVRDNSSSSWSLVVELRLCHLVGKCSNGS